jgi:hypothetical protein
MHYLNVTLDAKADEIVNIFSQGTMDEKTRVSRIMMEIDPARSNSYKKIREQNN